MKQQKPLHNDFDNTYLCMGVGKFVSSRVHGVRSWVLRQNAHPQGQPCRGAFQSKADPQRVRS